MLQGAAIRWLELNRDWRKWGRAWLSNVKSVQLVLPIDVSGDLSHTSDPEGSAEQQRERVAALVRQCPGCTSVRLRVKQEPFFDTAALGDNEPDYAESDSGSPSSKDDDEGRAPPDIEDPLDINAGLCALAELVGPRLLKLDLGNNCGRGPPSSGYLKSVGIVMDEGLALVAANCPNIVALDLSQCAPGYNWRDIKCERCFVGVHPATLLRLVESCGHSLQSLNIAGILSSRAMRSSRITTNPASDLPILTPLPDILTEAFQHCPALRYLNIKGNDALAGRSPDNADDLPPYLNALTSTCANLRCLDVRRVGSALWDAECLKDILVDCRNLKRIRWSSGSIIAEALRLSLAQSYPHVQLEDEDSEEYDDSE